MSKPLTTYPNCASTEIWGTCGNNCTGTRDSPCVDCNAKKGDPCGVQASGIGCVPKACVSTCCVEGYQPNIMGIGIL